MVTAQAAFAGVVLVELPGRRATFARGPPMQDWKRWSGGKGILDSQQEWASKEPREPMPSQTGSCTVTLVKSEGLEVIAILPPCA